MGVFRRNKSGSRLLRLVMKDLGGVVLVVLLCLDAVARVSGEQGAHRHHDNWAIVVGTSRYWHNYRHTTNPLLLYRFMREHGIPDRNIVLMLAGA